MLYFYNQSMIDVLTGQHLCCPALFTQKRILSAPVILLDIYSVRFVKYIAKADVMSGFCLLSSEDGGGERCHAKSSPKNQPGYVCKMFPINFYPLLSATLLWNSLRNDPSIGISLLLRYVEVGQCFFQIDALGTHYSDQMPGCLIDPGGALNIVSINSSTVPDTQLKCLPEPGINFFLADKQGGKRSVKFCHINISFLFFGGHRPPVLAPGTINSASFPLVSWQTKCISLYQKNIGVEIWGLRPSVGV